MGESEIRNRIDRAHRKAAHELMDYLHERPCEDPQWDQSRTYYCSAFIDEVYINDEGIKDYDRETLSQIMPHVIKEFSSKEFKLRVQDVLMGYKQSVLNRKILVHSAMAILTSRFPQKEIERFSVYAYSDTEICISKLTRKSNLWVKLDIMSLHEKAERVSRLKDLFR
jgi:hypothetical protein